MDNMKNGFRATDLVIYNPEETLGRWGPFTTAQIPA